MTAPASRKWNDATCGSSFRRRTATNRAPPRFWGSTAARSIVIWNRSASRMRNPLAFNLPVSHRMRPDMETLEQRIRRVTQEDVSITPYDPWWPELFRQEKEHLLDCLPNELIGRIEHFGSTAVPGLAAKPIVDILVEVADLQATRTRIAPVLESQGYDYFWRPSFGDDGPPFYAWFIKRQESGGAR